MQTNFGQKRTAWNQQPIVNKKYLNTQTTDCCGSPWVLQDNQKRFPLEFF